jgi:ribulose-5-phosphate 4-epimerase/fuculose-1-phosphate aldolase
MSADPAATLVQVARDLYLRGLSPGTTGNLSVRLDDAAIAITPTNGCLGYLDEDALSRIALADGRVLGGLPPSKEAPLHRIFYAEADIQAVVHLHSPWASTLSCLEDEVRHELTGFTPYFRMKVEPLALIPYFRPGSAEGPIVLRDNLHGCRSGLLRNHGTIAAASTLLDAVNVAEEIEHAARTWFATRGHQLRPLPSP